VWTTECQSAMDSVKEILCAAPALAFYDPNKKIRLTSDGSRKGIGAVLSHVDASGEVPVIFISRALRKAETNYSQVEIEALAVTWAFKKLKKYLWGREVEVLTDHKPLIRIFDPSKPIPDHLSSKLKRYCLFLREFAYRILFMAGKDIPNADVLSRLPLPNLEGDVEEFGGDFKIAFLQHTNVDDFLDIESLVKESDADEEMARVKACLLRGNSPATLPVELQDYSKRWNELNISHGAICLSERAVIPRSLRPKVLQFLHLNHFGVNKMKTLARTYFWWPKMDDDIVNLAQSCQPCALVNKAPNHAPVIPWSIPHRPWGRVHLDFFELGRGRSFIVAADGLSGWIDCEETKGMTATVAVKFCRRLFRVQGLCDTLVADNGPAFRAEEFKKFCSSNGVELIFAPPYSPQTNGVAERAVQTVKQFLRKTPSDEWANKLDSFILGHNSTPRANGVAPAEFNLGRRPLTVLDKIHPAAEWNRRQADRDRRAAAATVTSRKIPEQGQLVTFRNFSDPNKKRWQPGQLKRVLGPRRVLVEDQSGVQQERHLDQVKFHPPATPVKKVVEPECPEPAKPPDQTARNSGRPVRATRMPARLSGDSWVR
jgi:RNase H-like domain found in reverse transcriptase/Integrase zinc binding domain/Integrase core domain